ncbi:hypothetical protein [Mesorhizobium sp. LjNodule214]|uniref:hypothetical protein n=1 Tax=Mesorhizobium sp. LjNodule214 TaxID=3342252 RepID=UPI003ECF7AD9
MTAMIGHNRPPSEAEEAERFRFLILCNVIAKLRSLGATYRALARLTGVSKSTLNRWMPAIEHFAREWETDEACQARYRRFAEELHPNDLSQMGLTVARNPRHPAFPKAGLSHLGQANKGRPTCQNRKSPHWTRSVRRIAT